jgi:hypothetical protein
VLNPPGEHVGYGNRGEGQKRSAGLETFLMRLGDGSRDELGGESVVLQKDGGQYIIGEKLRDNQEVHKEVLAKRGRHVKLRENMDQGGHHRPQGESSSVYFGSQS